MYYKKVMSKKNFIYLYIIFLFYVQVNSAHLIENIKIIQNELILDVVSSNILVSVFDKDYNFINSAYSVNSSLKIALKNDQLENLKIISVKIPEKLSFEKFGSSGVTQGQFRKPCGVFIDYFNKIYVCDKDNNRIQVFDPNRIFSFEFGNFGWSTSINEIKGQFNKPSDIVVNRFIYVCDTENHRVAKFSIDGSFLSSWGGNGLENGKFNFPKGIEFDFSGDIYVADTENDRIQKFDSNGNFILSIGSYGRSVKQFNRPNDIAVDREYNIFVADTKNNRIQMFDRFGGFKKFFKFGEKFLKSPESIAVIGNVVAVGSERNSTLYMSDRNDNFNKQFKLDFRPSKMSFVNSNQEIILYITSTKDNCIYYTEFEKDERSI